MVVSINFSGVEEAIIGLKEFQRTYFGQLKEEIATLWEEKAGNVARAHAPTQQIKDSIKTEVTRSNTEQWQPFELKMTSDAPSLMTAEFGRERSVQEREDRTNPAERTKPLIDQVIAAVFIGGLFMAGAAASFFSEVEAMDWFEDKLLLS